MWHDEDFLGVISHMLQMTGVKSSMPCKLFTDMRSKYGGATETGIEGLMVHHLEYSESHIQKLYKLLTLIPAVNSNKFRNEST